MKEANTAPAKRSAKEQMIRGSAWMTAGSIMSRVLGAIYVIPWRVWLGTAFLAANSLFIKGYQIYSIFLVISTAGVPGAISKQIARYNAMNEYATGFRLFKTGLIAMILMGVGAGGVLWFAAPVLALRDPALTAVFRSLAWPLLLIPALSILRGFFQGYNEMAPSAISQFIEQLARVFYMMLMTYSIMRLGSGDYVSAVTQSTFAAFIGAVFGLLVLAWYFVRQRERFRVLEDQSANEVQVSTRHLLYEIISQAIPFIVMDGAINVYYVIDQYTFPPLMHLKYIVSDDRLGEIYALFAGNANKLIMIVVSLAVAMATAALPLLASARTRGDVKGVGVQITSILQLFFIVMVPSSFGLAAVATPLYVVFYGYDALGIKMLLLATVLAILLGLFTVLAGMLQGLFHNRLAIRWMLVGLLAKVLTQWPAIFFFGVYGPTVSSMIGLVVSIVLMLASLHALYRFSARQTWHRLVGIIAFSIIMAIIVRLVLWGLGMVVPPTRSLTALLSLGVGTVIGAGVYAWLVLKTRLADMIIGTRVAGLRRRLHIG